MNRTKSNLLVKNIFLSLYFLVSILIIFIGGNIIKIANICEIADFFNSSIFNRFYPFIILAFLGVVYEYLFKPKFKTLYYGIIPIFVTLSMAILLWNSEEEILKNKVSIVTRAIIFETSSTKMQFFVLVSYEDETYKYSSTIKVKQKHGNCPNRIQIGDTVLLMYSKECPAIIDLYKVCPTKSELEKCKNDCYLIHGKLIPVDEVDEKDLWKY